MGDLSDGHRQRQQAFYDAEWEHMELADTLTARGWRTLAPAPDFMEFLDSVRIDGLSGEVLDLGCGAGRHAVAFALAGFQVSGIDFAEAAIARAREHAAASGVAQRTHFMVGDVLQLPYDDGQFTIVNDDGCLHHIAAEDRQQYAADVRRVLAVGGLFRAKVFSRHCQYFEDNQESGVQSSWVWTADSGFTYFFDEEEIAGMFGQGMRLLNLEQKVHPKTDAKRFYYALFRKDES